MKPHKIFMLDFEFPPIGGGGGQAHLNILHQYAGREDLAVTVLASAPEPGFTVEQFAPNIVIHRAGIRKRNLHYWRRTEVLAWLAKAWHRYRQLLRRDTFDLAHAFFAFPTGWVACRQADRLPYIISLRGSDVPGRHSRLQLDYKLLAGPMRRIWKRSAGLVACSTGLRERAWRFLPAAPIAVIPNGVDLDRFRPAENLRPAGPWRLLTVGRLTVTKRMESLAGVVLQLGQAGIEVRLTVAGGGALEEKFRQLVAECGLNGRIDITGRQEPDLMPELYRRHDLFVSATMQEGMSNAMLEAMASGLPLVTTRCEGVEELIRDNGLVVEQPAALGQAVMELLHRPDRLAEMAAASRRRAGRFTWSGVASRYLDYYRNVMERLARRPAGQDG